MRLRTTCAGIVLALTIVTGPAFALCEDKSQQNAADEAGLKGDLESVRNAGGCCPIAKKARGRGGQS
jgi:hypothetical protein